MRPIWMLVGWMLVALCALPAAEDASPAAEAAENQPEPAAPATPTAFDWTSLETIPRWTIENEHAVVEISSWRGSIRRFMIKTSHPIPVPEWRGGRADKTDTDQPLSILDLYNPTTPELQQAFGHATDMHNYVGSIGLRDNPLPAEGPWKLVERAEDRLTVGHAADGYVYRLHYRLDPDRPTVHVTLRVRNNSEAPARWQPTVITINGIHQDDPRNELYDLKLVGSFDAAGDGTGGEFEKWSLPDPYKTTNLSHPDLDLPAMPASRVDYLGLKSRFFTTFWSPGQVEVLGGEAAAEEQPPAGGDLGAMLEEGGTGPAVVEDDYLILARAYGYTQPMGTDFARQAWVATKLFARDGKPFEVAPGEVLEARWSITAASMQRVDLAKLTPAEQRIEYTDAWYNFFKILVKILTFVLNLVVAVVQNYGVAVIIFVILIKAALHKLNVKQQKGMAKMQQMAPKLKELQERYKADRQTLARKQMEMMQQEGANPLGGCLPLLIQMPIFFAMFQTFRHYADLREHGFLWIDDLTMPDQMFYLFPLPFAIPLFGADVTFNLLPLLYIAIMCFSSFSNKIPDDAPDQQKQMAKMMRWLPIIFGVICYNFPAGLLLYMCCSALIGTLEMKYIRKKYGTTGVAMPA